ncbi:PilN family type IVB pilus formation outer membrane protein [Burkholderia cenocepacia]|uniref:PilN family type IVB pilus formation outer membrane protein n=1 Tax=Burkholderia cenocepacia TaxID=95486 RepID=UPI002AB09A6F|nr:PilN family type IVB pilus formation outer membrane protein [Burkholderia cenocepacia]
MSKLIKMLAAFMLPLSMGACSFMESVDARNDEIYRASRDQAKALRETAIPSAVTLHDRGFWVSTRDAPMKKKAVDLSCNITLMETAPISLFDLGDRIESICGVPVEVDVSQPKSLGAASGNDSGAVASTAGASMFLSQPSAPPLPGLSAGMVSPIKWSGTLTGLLNQIASQTGTHWEAVNGGIRIFKYATKVFRIYALPGTEALSTSMGTTGSLSTGASSSSSGSGSVSTGSGAGSGGTIGTSSQNVQISMKQSILDDIQKTVTNMLSSAGTMTLAQSTSSVTVTDTPAVLARVRDYIEQQNRILTTQIVLNVKILGVTFDREDQYGIDWNKLAYTSSRVAAALTSGGGAAPSDAQRGQVKILRGPFKDANLLIDALSTQGKVSVVTQPSVTTLNLQSVPMQVATQTGYVASVSSTVTPQVGTTTGITPGTVTSGFNMLLLPYAMPDGRVLLKYDIGFSSLKALEKFGDAARGEIQLPTIDQWAFSQKVRLRSGETLVLSGYEQDQNTGNDRGTIVPQNILFGGSTAAKRKHTVIVILINPVVLQ